MPPSDPVKLICLKVRNTGRQPRRLSATFYAEWVLGTVRDQAPMNVVTEIDVDSGALLARNPFNADYAGHVAFADVDARPRSCTADRTEFLGRNGGLDAPAGLERAEWYGAAGPALDPCVALRTPFELQPGEEREIVFVLGQAANVEEARGLARRYREPGRARAAFKENQDLWERILGTIQVRTPNPGMDLLLNRWLLYQVLSCRFWGRSAFYQSGGAYGFRDQLQDVLALVYAAPEETRAHLLRSASRQFKEGDVQHWWHPPRGAGVRTRCSDDYLWLPFAAAHYVAATGDAAVLDERAPFIEAPVLKPDQEEDYRIPDPSAETATLYEHCVRALEHGLTFGAHGLPLMGTGDWNDGMNRVGAGGRGESVWLGWFLLTVLRSFAEVAESRGDGERAARWREQADRLATALEEHAWDGRWYRRAYFDDGTPLGSAENDECRIDGIAQSWAVISGGAGPERARQAFAAADEMLVREADRLILLFTPPFDKGHLQPGYIKGYLPGIRENGGQYTHGAAWLVQAAALLGRGERAVALFDLLNPIHHADSREKTGRYKTEPYAVAGDVYSEPPHTGRGGWSWYTGSASWLYRAALENILGFRLRGNRLTLAPCVPADWEGYEITLRHGSTTYAIRAVRRGAGRGRRAGRRGGRKSDEGRGGGTRGRRAAAYRPADARLRPAPRRHSPRRRHRVERSKEPFLKAGEPAGSPRRDAPGGSPTQGQRGSLMSTPFNRRRFVQGTLTAGALAGLGDFSFLNRLPAVGAAEAALSPSAVRFGPEIEPLVRLIEETPREKLLEAAVGKVREGVGYQRLLSAVFLAGVRNIQPRPVGFEFHCVLAVHSAHLAALAAADADRWLALFWRWTNSNNRRRSSRKRAPGRCRSWRRPSCRRRSGRGRISSRRWTTGTRRAPTGRRPRWCVRPGRMRSSSCSRATGPAISATSATRRSTWPTPRGR